MNIHQTQQGSMLTPSELEWAQLPLQDFLGVLIVTAE